MIAQAFLAHREQISDAGVDHGDGMHVDPEDRFRASPERFSVIDSGRGSCAQEAAHRVKEKSSRPAGRIEHPLFERLVNYMLARPLSKPIGRVVFAEVMA